METAIKASAAAGALAGTASDAAAGAVAGMAEDTVAGPTAGATAGATAGVATGVEVGGEASATAGRELGTSAGAVAGAASREANWTKWFALASAKAGVAGLPERAPPPIGFEIRLDRNSAMMACTRCSHSLFEGTRSTDSAIHHHLPCFARKCAVSCWPVNTKE